LLLAWYSWVWVQLYIFEHPFQASQLSFWGWKYGPFTSRYAWPTWSATRAHSSAIHRCWCSWWALLLSCLFWWLELTS
jgi:hypothetical protein